jgi:hypothetical protein
MQQPVRTTISNLPDYNKVFQQHIIPRQPPKTVPVHNYYDANNLNYVDNLDNIGTDVVVIDSSSRNWDKEENNNYTIFLGKTFNYVHSIELVDGYVPASGYIVNNNNNVIHFQEDNDPPTSAIIKPGNYLIKGLLEVLSEVMTDASPNHYKYTCSVDKNTMRVTISCDHKFNLIFADGMEVVGDRGIMETLVINPETNRKELQKVEVSDSRRKYIKDSIGKLIGFKPINLECRKHYTGQMNYNLQPYQYLAIFLNTENADNFSNITAPSPDNGANDAFAVVSLDGGCYKLNQVIDNGHFSMGFNPPIHFNKFKIQLRTIDGQLYDFNGVDHYLVFEVKRIFNKEIVKTLKNLS